MSIPILLSECNVANNKLIKMFCSLIFVYAYKVKQGQEMTHTKRDRMSCSCAQQLSFCCYLREQSASEDAQILCTYSNHSFFSQYM